MITLENLLSKGYFPKELPPPFTTKKYAEEYIKNRSKFKGYTSFKKDTECINYSLAKVGLIRKTINIPNPSQQSPLCELIIEKWSEIEAAIQRSSISSTKLRSKGKRAYNIMPFKEFRRKCFLVSYQYKYEVKTDISQFFGSIYTHSIPWALHGKSISKVHANRTNYSLLGVDLDRRIRCTTHGQTNGIPISPDTSLIISEIVASSIDYQIQKAFPGIKGCRYVDDMYFFFDSLGQAEKFLIKLQEVLQSYQLSLNSSKTKISKLPIGLDEEWINELRSFNFRETEIKQYNDIINYFSLAFRLARENPSEFVLSYAVRTTMYLKVLSKDNYQLLEIMLLKAVSADQSVIADVFKVIYTNRENSNLNRVKNVVFKIINDNLGKGHDYELSWALWIVRSFEFSLPDETVQKLRLVRDQISMMIIYDIIKLGKIDKTKFDSSFWTAQLNVDSLRNDYWLFAYEMTVKDWEKFEDNYTEKIGYFKALKKLKVEFYNPQLQIEEIGVAVSGDDSKESNKSSYAIFEPAEVYKKKKTVNPNSSNKIADEILSSYF